MHLTERPPESAHNGVAASRYDAFISYSHEADGELAPALQAGIEKFAKPWNRMRALRVFRDNSSLSAEPALWPSIEAALENSSWFVLIASSQAAHSPWVDREVKWWLDNKSRDRLLLVVADGKVHWDERAHDFDWSRSNALPPSLRGAFTDEPRWVDASWSREADQLSNVDPRMQEAVADISSRIRGVPKDELVGAAVREHRKTRRIVRSVQAAGAVLVLGLIGATVFALIQRSNAIKQATLATSRQLAALSQSKLSSNLDVALLLAVQAYRADANPQTRAALIQADLASPRLVRFLPFGATVSALAGSNDRRTVVAGLADGRVMRWDLSQSAPRRIAELGHAVKSVAVSANGQVVVAVDGSEGLLWRSGRPLTRISGPAGQRPFAVTVSPSGGTAVFYFDDPAAQGQSIVVVDVAHRRVSAIHPIADPAWFPTTIVAPSDRALFMLDYVNGIWQRRRLPDWKLDLASSAGYANDYIRPGVSGDGRFFTITTGVSPIPVWSASGPTSPTTFPLTAQAPISNPTALTISPGGGQLAVADSESIYIAPTAKPASAHQAPDQLVGSGAVNPNALAFFGDPQHLLSASGDTVALWNLTQYDRLADVQSTALPPTCETCQVGASAAVSPDGTKVAVVNSDGSYAVVHALPGNGHFEWVNPGQGNLGPPVWDRSGRDVLLPITRAAVPSHLPPDIRMWSVPGNSNTVAAALRADGRSEVLVSQDGTVSIRDVDTGRVQRTIPGPPTLGDTPLARGTAAIDPSGTLAVIVDNGRALVTDVDPGRVIARLPGADVQSATFAGANLLVQRQDGSLEVWDARATERRRVIPGDQSYAQPPVADLRGDLVARERSDGSVDLDDVSSGATLATLAAPGRAFPGLRLGLGLSPTGSELVSVVQTDDASPKPEIIDHDLSPQALIRSACATAGRSLTPAQWRAYVGTAPPSHLGCS